MDNDDLNPNADLTDIDNSSNYTLGGEINLPNALVGSVICFVAFSEQIIVLVVVWNDKRLHSPSCYYMVSLALADMLLSMFPVPAWTFFNTVGYWPKSHLVCDLWNSVDHSLCLVSIYTIVFLIYERYRSIREPLRYMTNLTPKRMKTCLIAVWIFGFVVGTTYIFTGRYFSDEDYINTLSGCISYHIKRPTIAIVYTVVVLVLPLVIISASQILIYFMLRKSRLSMEATRTHGAGNMRKCELLKGNPQTNNCPVEAGMKTKSESVKSKLSTAEVGKDKKALLTIALLIGAFSVCWLPLASVIVTERIHPGWIKPKWFVVTYWLCYMNTVLNPICYAAGNPNFRRTLRKLVSKRKRLPSSTL